MTTNLSCAFFDKNIKEEIGRRYDVTLRRKIYQTHDHITFYHMIISTEKQRRTMISCFILPHVDDWLIFILSPTTLATGNTVFDFS